MEIVAKSKFIKTAPDKIRILSNILKNRKIDDALAQLTFVNKVGAKPLSLALKQAKGQIKDKNKEVNDFLIKTLQVDEGPKLKRRRIVHQGRATMILKRMSHVKIVLTDDGNPKSEVPNSKKITNSKLQIPNKDQNKEEKPVEKSSEKKVTKKGKE